MPHAATTCVVTHAPPSLTLCSGPADDPSRKKLGAFLVQTQLQGSVNSSAMFLTAAAQVGAAYA